MLLPILNCNYIYKSYKFHFNRIIEQQDQDGSYFDNTYQLHDHINSIDNKVWTTSFILKTLEECPKCHYKSLRFKRSKDKAYAFLSQSKSNNTDILAISLYARVLYTNNNKAELDIGMLLNMLSQDLDKTPIASFNDIDTLGYSLMIMSRLGRFEKAKNIFHSLNRILNQQKFILHFDTLIGLQALTYFINQISSKFYKKKIPCVFGEQNNTHFHIKKLSPQSENAPSLDNHLKTYFYPSLNDETCQFDMTIDTNEISLNNNRYPFQLSFHNKEVRSHISRLRIGLNITIKYLRRFFPSGQVIVEVALFTGMTPISNTLPFPNQTVSLAHNFIKKDTAIQNIYVTDNAIYFVIKEVCFTRLLLNYVSINTLLLNENCVEINIATL
ncbi:unnamed protein product [Gordionus sp. m RMFG-2023]